MCNERHIKDEPKHDGDGRCDEAQQFGDFWPFPRCLEPYCNRDPYAGDCGDEKDGAFLPVVVHLMVSQRFDAHRRTPDQPRPAVGVSLTPRQISEVQDIRDGGDNCRCHQDVGGFYSKQYRLLISVQRPCSSQIRYVIESYHTY